MDDFNSLSNRLLNRAPQVGIVLSQQFINDAWRTLQSRRQWSWRRGHGTFAPPDLYQTGFASTNVGNGNPLLVTGLNTTWTPDMVGRQIRLGGLMYPYYTIAGWLSPTALLLDQPWAGNEITNGSYGISQVYFPTPDDFGFFYAIVSIKDGYRLWLNLTEADLDMMDPQRTNSGQTYAVAFRDYTSIYQGSISPCVPLGAFTANPISTTSLGYNYPIPATYLITIQGSGVTGAATFVWTRIGTTGLSNPVTTQAFPQDLSDGVQVYFPDGANWTAGNSWVINAQPLASTGVARYEFWPAPTYSQYLYPYQYIKKEYDLTVNSPQLPPFIASRGEVLLEMGLQKCAEYPGADVNSPNPYHDLRQAVYHKNNAMELINDLERNDEEVGVSNIDYEAYPFYPAPWCDGNWQQSHAPFLNG